MHGLTIYKSSAGSGKTFTLVKEFLKLALQNPFSFRNILAVTFTNKATAEMKSRIVEALVEITEGKGESLLDAIVSELDSANRKSLKKNAQTTLRLILHDYSRFAVTTIDSFFHNVLRSCSREMGLPLRLEVELDTERVMDEITHSLLEQAGRDKILTQWLEELVAAKVTDERGWHIEPEIRSAAKEIFRERFYDAGSFPPSEKIRETTSKLITIRKQFESRMKQFGEEAIAAISSAGLTTEDFTFGNKGPAGYFSKILTVPKDLSDYRKNDEKSRVRKALSGPDSWTTKSSIHKDRIRELASSQLIPILEKTLSFADKNFSIYLSAVEVLRLIHLFGITGALLDELRKYRDEQQVLLISDISRLLQHLTGGNDAAFIFEKTGSLYHHFLVDEFQDTSGLQWNNLLPLIRNSLSEGNSSMVVGDAKQSIYRWRGGNLKLLLEKIREDLFEFDEMIEEKSLAANYRSGDKIIEFNNLFFSSAPKVITEKGELQEGNLVSTAYREKDLIQVSPKKQSSPGLVSVSFIEHDKEEEEGWKDKALAKMLDTIKTLEQNKFRLKDIAILTRSNTDGNTIAGYLFENGYTKIITPDSLLLSGSQKIRFLLSLLRLLNDPSDDVSAACVLHYQILHNNDPLRAAPGPEVMHEAFSHHRDLISKELPPAFTEHRTYLARLPLYELVEQLVQIFELADPPDAYIQRFQDVILEFTARHSAGIRGFLEWWEENKKKENCSLITSPGEDAITIMTIHKVKGLQFPAVIVPFCDWKMTPRTDDILWTQSAVPPFSELPMIPLKASKNIRETIFSDAYAHETEYCFTDNLNMLYVAFTRPEQCLYAFAPMPGTETLSSTSDLIHQVILQNPGLKNSWDEKSKSLAFGTLAPASPEEKKAGTIPVEQLSGYISSRWQSRITVRSKSKDLAEVLGTSPAEKINYGKLMHLALENIYVKEDLESSLLGLQHAGWISEGEKPALRASLEKLFSDPKTAPYFNSGWEIKNEREFILPGGEILRPDRVLLKNKEAVVIDYKTGEKRPGHDSQVKRYSDVMKKMGYEKVSSLLIYIQPSAIETVLL